MPDRTRELEFDVVVVGAGPAGLAAATVAAESGRRVALVEATPWLGGQIWRGDEAGTSNRVARHWFNRFQKSGAEVFRETTVFAAPERSVLLAEQVAPRAPTLTPTLSHPMGEGARPLTPSLSHPTGEGARPLTPSLSHPTGEGARPLTPSLSHPMGEGGVAFTWRKLVLATGARELFLPFPGWTLPNVVGAGGLSALLKGGLPVRDKRVVVAGSGPLLIAVAAELRQHGAKVACVVEQASLGSLVRFGAVLPWLAPGKLAQAVRFQALLLGVPFKPHSWLVQALGPDRLEAVELTDGARRWTQPCDYLACGFGLVPSLELPQLLGCRVTDGVVQVSRFQATTVPDVFCAGEPTGIGGAERAVLEGQIAGLSASGHEVEAARLLPAHARRQRFVQALAEAFRLRPELRMLARPDTIVCRCEDVPRAALDHCPGWHAAKLHTRCGMGPCQGRVCGGATRFLYGWDNDSTRPPALPVSLGALATRPARASIR